MAISKKGKRKIVVNSKTYFWWVFDEYDQTVFDGLQIKVVSENQLIFFQYGLQQTDEKRKLVMVLRDFARVQLLCPKFEDKTGIITPLGISKLIHWGSIKNVQEILYVWSNKNKNPTQQQMIQIYDKILQAI